MIRMKVATRFISRDYFRIMHERHRVGLSLKAGLELDGGSTAPPSGHQVK